MHNHHDFDVAMPIFWGLFALAFWIVPTILRHRARMKALDVTQKLLEKGVTAPPELIEALKPQLRPPSSPARDLRTGAIMLAVAIGLVGLGLVLQFDGFGPPGLHPVFGVAAFPGLIGLTLIGLWWFNPERRR